MANNSSLSKRAALKQQQQLEEQRKRTRRIAAVGGALVVVTIAVIVAIVLVTTLSRGSGVAAEQSTPPGATQRDGILLGPEPSADVPHLVIWEDYQCPACKSREDVYGPAIEQLVDNGSITAEIRTTYFMDANLLNDSSEKAALAAAAAAEVGHYREMHKVIYQNQPSEGSGYTERQLREEFPAQAGITGDNLTRYQELLALTPFKDFVDKANARFRSDAIHSTPTFLVAGKPLQFADNNNNVLIQPDANSLLEAITKTWQDNQKNNDF